jgi:hypothetical protein
MGEAPGVRCLTLKIALPLTNHLTLGKSLKLSTYFLHLIYGNNNLTLWSLWEILSLFTPLFNVCTAHSVVLAVK